MFKHIVVGTDGSECAAIATDKALELAANQQAKLTVVFVASPYPYLLAEEKTAFIKSAQAVADQAFEAIKSNAAGVDVTCKLVENSSVEKAISEVIDASDADLLVVGSHGYSGLNRLLLGSVANKLIASAKVPVLVARQSS